MQLSAWRSCNDWWLYQYKDSYSKFFVWELFGNKDKETPKAIYLILAPIPHGWSHRVVSIAFRPISLSFRLLVMCSGVRIF